MSELKNRYDFVYLFDVQDGNPNGDPDAANLPRVDAETGNGLVTDVCLKRKIRNYVEVAKEGAPTYEIFIQEKAVLDNLVEDVYKEEEVKKADKNTQKDAAKKALCAKYYDIRAFGAVIATKDKQGQVRGTVQLTFAPEMLLTSSRSEARMSAGSLTFQSVSRAMDLEGMRARLASGLMRSIRVAERSPTFTPAGRSSSLA